MSQGSRGLGAPGAVLQQQPLQDQGAVRHNRAATQVSSSSSSSSAPAFAGHPHQRSQSNGAFNPSPGVHDARTFGQLSHQLNLAQSELDRLVKLQSEFRLATRKLGKDGNSMAREYMYRPTPAKLEALPHNVQAYVKLLPLCKNIDKRVREAEARAKFLDEQLARFGDQPAAASVQHVISSSGAVAALAHPTVAKPDVSRLSPPAQGSPVVPAFPQHAQPQRPQPPKESKEELGAPPVKPESVSTYIPARSPIDSLKNALKSAQANLTFLLEEEKEFERASRKLGSDDRELLVDHLDKQAVVERDALSGAGKAFIDSGDRFRNIKGRVREAQEHLARIQNRIKLTAPGDPEMQRGAFAKEQAMAARARIVEGNERVETLTKTLYKFTDAERATAAAWLDNKGIDQRDITKNIQAAYNCQKSLAIAREAIASADEELRAWRELPSLPVMPLPQAMQSKTQAEQVWRHAHAVACAQPVTMDSLLAFSDHALPPSGEQGLPPIPEGAKTKQLLAQRDAAEKDFLQWSFVVRKLTEFEALAPSERAAMVTRQLQA